MTLWKINGEANSVLNQTCGSQGKLNQSHDGHELAEHARGRAILNTL